jgi:hypothetical protein
MIDGFVKNLSVPLGAGLRLNPALLDKKSRSGGVKINLMIFEEENPFEGYLTG